MVNLNPYDDRLPDEIVVSTRNVDYTIQYCNPHGFYKINTSKGQVPKKLKGMFTDPRAAKKAVEHYISDKNFVLKPEAE